MQSIIRLLEIRIEHVGHNALIMFPPSFIVKLYIAIVSNSVPIFVSNITARK